MSSLCISQNDSPELVLQGSDLALLFQGYELEYPSTCLITKVLLPEPSIPREHIKKPFLIRSFSDFVVHLVNK